MQEKYINKRSGLKADLDVTVLQSTFFAGDLEDCNGLRKALCRLWYNSYGGSKGLGAQLSSFCGRRSTVDCEELYEELEEKVEELEKKLSELTHPSPAECLYFSGWCTFLVHLFPELTQLCNIFEAKCYTQERHRATVTVLLSFLSGYLHTLEECHHRLKGVCVSLAGTTPEARFFCLSWYSTCVQFMKTYGDNHKHQSRLGSNADDVRTELYAVFNKTFEDTGVYIDIPDINHQYPYDPSLGECHRHLNNCSPYDTGPYISELCTNGTENPNGTDACNKFPHRLTRPDNGYLANLSKFFSHEELILQDINPISLILTVDTAATECAKVFGQCFFYSHYGDHHLKEQCVRFSAYCYRSSLAKLALEHLLGKHYHGEFPKGTECHRKLARGSCKRLPTSDLTGLYYCLHLDTTCETLATLTANEDEDLEEEEDES
ncbi:hypothetical protein PMAC_003203 [Pneumocystis sp. 'macacae']|nr:hypothetical protein PMAC_003203 [Pneumocystis sp. 'macacae']